MGKMTTEQTRAEFVQLERQVYGRPLVYLDNAATSLRPRSVVDCLVQMCTRSNSNIHRAVHCVAQEATDFYEQAREAVRAYIGAPSSSNVIFTSGATASINLVAFAFGEARVGEGDEIIVSEAEHHSNIVPWQMLCERKGAVLKVLEVDDDGHLRLDRLGEMLSSERVKLLCVSQVSNVLGLANPLDKIISMAHSASVPVLVDGAQGIVHGGVDVGALGCDFYAFSGHKVYAATGTGVLYMSDKWIDTLGPWQGGGEMIASVKWSGTSFAARSERFEAGTPNFNAVPTLKPALELAGQMEEDSSITSFLLEELPRIQGLRLYGIPHGPGEKKPIFSFTVEGAHHEDLALIMDKMGIALRSGQMCAEPLMDRFGVSGMLRASFAPYNTLQEAQYFVQSLEKAIKMLV